MKKIGLVLAVLALCAVTQAGILIDGFTSTNPAGGWTLKATTLGVAVTKSETGLSGVYGGTRDVSYTVYASLSGTSMTMGSGLVTENTGALAWSKATLAYNGGGGAGGLGLDLTSGTKLSVDRFFDHMGKSKNTVFSITLYDGAQSATVSKIWTTYVTSGVNVTEDFLFSSFLAQNASLNLSSIDNITVYLETDQGGDYGLLTGLTTDAIPEPATMLLLGLGAVLLRKKK